MVEGEKHARGRGVAEGEGNIRGSRWLHRLSRHCRLFLVRAFFSSVLALFWSPLLRVLAFLGPGCLAFGLFCSPFFVFELLWVPALSPFAFFFSRSFTFAGSQGLFCSLGPQVSRALVSRLFSCEVNRPRQWTEGRCPSAKQVSSVERGRRRAPSEAGVERCVKESSIPE